MYINSSQWEGGKQQQWNPRTVVTHCTIPGCQKSHIIWMTRYITQSMFIVIGNKTFSERWKRTYRVVRYSYSDGRDVCAYTGISGSWVTTETCGQLSRWLETQWGESKGPKQIPINQSAYPYLTAFKPLTPLINILKYLMYPCTCPLVDYWCKMATVIHGPVGHKHNFVELCWCNNVGNYINLILSVI